MNSDNAFEEKIEQLKNNKMYDEIYNQFGAKVYSYYVPTKYKRQDIKKLKQEKRWLDIYNKYGEKQYNKILIKAMYEEIKEARGTAKAMLWRTVQSISNATKRLGITSLLSFFTATGVLALTSEDVIERNAIQYESKINDYNEKISEYAKEVQEMGLSDVQTFMKVMDDMWKNIKGYANPEKNILGFFELELATEEGYGVCRNMASDVAKKLNEINPEWNARIIAVLTPEDLSGLKTANIETTVLDRNETVVKEESEDTAQDKKTSSKFAEKITDRNETVVKEENEDTEQDKKTKSDLTEKIADTVIGDHMVVLVDIPEDNITLVLDPTNPAIGIYLNGNIIMLNSTNEQDINYNAKEWITGVFFKGGKDGITSTMKEYAQSFRRPNITLEEIKEKYGLEAQNEALEQVRTGNIHSDSKEKMFRKYIKAVYNSKDNENEISRDNNIEKDNIVKDNEGR